MKIKELPKAQTWDELKDEAAWTAVRVFTFLCGAAFIVLLPFEVADLFARGWVAGNGLSPSFLVFPWAFGRALLTLRVR